MKNIKLVACDLDGTLLNDDGKISKENLLAIKELSRREIYFVPASGRAWRELISDLTDSEYIDYYILSSGADIYDKKRDEHNAIYVPRETVARIVSAAQGLDALIIVHCENESRVDQDGLSSYESTLGYLADLFKSRSRIVKNLADEIVRRSDIDFLCVVVKDAKALEELFDEIVKIPELEFAKNTLGRGLFNVEIAARHATKGDAVIRLAKMLGIDESEVAVIGDSQNDYSMISRFENSFAVKNARSVIKEAAKYELCSNNEHAIEYLLKNVIGD